MIGNVRTIFGDFSKKETQAIAIAGQTELQVIASFHVTPFVQGIPLQNNPYVDDLFL